MKNFIDKTQTLQNEAVSWINGASISKKKEIPIA